ncbi:hypothetical protein C8Q79DRAFT_292239 [Trametes meyenii]|nr:hypothetical protein C8Q79DRAFT_292239 [Trametes meyenii]
MEDSEPRLVFLSLPTDIVIEVLENAGGRTISRCKAVCRALRELIQGSPCLEYLIELAAANMVETPPPGGHSIPYHEASGAIAKHGPVPTSTPQILTGFCEGSSASGSDIGSFTPVDCSATKRVR